MKPLVKIIAQKANEQHSIAPKPWIHVIIDNEFVFFANSINEYNAALSLMSALSGLGFIDIEIIPVDLEDFTDFYLSIRDYNCSFTQFKDSEMNNEYDRIGRMLNIVPIEKGEQQ
jgi:hypothetical protein